MRWWGLGAGWTGRGVRAEIGWITALQLLAAPERYQPFARLNDDGSYADSLTDFVIRLSDNSSAIAPPIVSAATR